MDLAQIMGLTDIQRAKASQYEKIAKITGNYFTARGPVGEERILVVDFCKDTHAIYPDGESHLISEPIRTP